MIFKHACMSAFIALTPAEKDDFKKIVENLDPTLYSQVFTAKDFDTASRFAVYVNSQVSTLAAMTYHQFVTVINLKVRSLPPE